MKKYILSLVLSSTALLSASNLFAEISPVETLAKKGSEHHHKAAVPAYGSFYINAAKDDQKTPGTSPTYKYLEVQDGDNVIFRHQNPSHNVEFDETTGEIFIKKAGDYVVTYGVIGCDEAPKNTDNGTFDLCLDGLSLPGASLYAEFDGTSMDTLSTTIAISDKDVAKGKALTLVNQTGGTFTFAKGPDATVAFITVERVRR